jgi:8-oxo-dGTP diphosphatase
MNHRACGAVIQDNEILMVRHIHDGRDYWTLPGGAIEENETPENAAVREVLEETGLDLKATRFLFSTKNQNGSSSHCFMMSRLSTEQVATLGHDPEQAHLRQSERMLQDIAWYSLDAKRDDIQVCRVIEALGIKDEI